MSIGQRQNAPYMSHILWGMGSYEIKQHNGSI